MDKEKIKGFINTSIDKAADFAKDVSDKRDNQLIDTSNQNNKVVNVNLKGGILGILADSPQNTLNKRIKKENANGWKVIQVIPASSGNLFLLIFRIFLLIITFLFYTTSNGYYIIMEKVDTGKKNNTNEPKCSKCGNSISLDDVFCESCGNKV